MAFVFGRYVLIASSYSQHLLACHPIGPQYLPQTSSSLFVAASKEFLHLLSCAFFNSGLVEVALWKVTPGR